MHAGGALDSRAPSSAGCEKLAKKEIDAFAAGGWSALESFQFGSSTWEP